MRKVFFVDFDGTITKRDTCTAMVEAFAEDGWEEIDKLWEDKKLSTEECANMIFKFFHATLEDIKNLMDTIQIDDYFKDFIALCREKGHEIYILSDGYDFNIKTILERHNIEIKYYANKLSYTRDKGFSIECVYNDPECKSCGTCKKTLMKKLKSEADQVVYIGDGYSDMCPAAFADIVFAKGVLYRFCMEKSIRAIPYTDFGDIISSGRI